MAQGISSELLKAQANVESNIKSVCSSGGPSSSTILGAADDVYAARAFLRTRIAIIDIETNNILAQHSRGGRADYYSYQHAYYQSTHPNNETNEEATNEESNNKANKQ